MKEATATATGQINSGGKGQASRADSKSCFGPLLSYLSCDQKVPHPIGKSLPQPSGRSAHFLQTGSVFR